MTAIHDVIIIGSGPAGYTAALYAARAQLKPLVFEGSVTAGGALMNTTDVENYPGFPGGITGPDLMDAMRKQAERFGAKLVAEDVTEVDLRADPKRVIAEGETYLAQAVIIATGSGYRELGVPGEKRLGGHGVSWCATCDGFFFRGQDIAVAGGGDSAMEEATFLTRFGRTVTVIHRRDRLRASKIMQERAFANPKIKFRWNSEVTEILGEEKITGLRLRDTVTGRESTLEAGGLFVAIGHDPRSGLFTGQLATDDEGYLLVGQPATRTAIPGVFACGDVVDRTYRQAVTAAGTGCAAALDAERFLAGGTNLTTHTDRRQPLARTVRDSHRPGPPAASSSNRAAKTERKNRMGATRPVTDETFEAELLQSTRTVLVDYWAERCGLSKMIAPILEAIAEEHGDKLGIVKLNVDENPQVTQKYNILNIPTWRRIRRFRLTGALDGPGPGAPEHGSFLSVHELAGPEVLEDPGYRAAVSTPWRDRVVASALRRERRVFGLRNAIGA